MFFLLITVISVVHQTLRIRLGSYERYFCDLCVINCIAQFNIFRQEPLSTQNSAIKELLEHLHPVLPKVEGRKTRISTDGTFLLIYVNFGVEFSCSSETQHIVRSGAFNKRSVSVEDFWPLLLHTFLMVNERVLKSPPFLHRWKSQRLLWDL